MGNLAYYTLELASPKGGWSQLPQLSADARRASEQLTREGTSVRFVRTVFVPEDETCFHLYEAASADAVCEAARRAGLPLERVIEAISQPQPGCDVSVPFSRRGS
jgi:hypothetical protein